MFLRKAELRALFFVPQELHTDADMFILLFTLATEIFFLLKLTRKTSPFVTWIYSLGQLISQMSCQSLSKSDMSLSELSKTTAGVSSSVEEQQSFSKHHFFFGWPVAAFLTVLHYFFDTVLLNSEFLFSCMLLQFTCHDFVLPFLFALCNVASQ